MTQHRKRPAEDQGQKGQDSRPSPLPPGTVAGRLVVAALTATDRATAAAGRADVAEDSLRRADYLAALDRRLSETLDQARTELTIAQVALPEPDAWAVVDLATPNGDVVRLAVVHPDPDKQRVTEMLNMNWLPRGDDPIGYPAVKRAGKPIALTEGVDSALTAASHTAEDLALLRELGFAACLMVPIWTAGEIDGAITFVSAHSRTGYTREEVGLAEQIAEAVAHALRNARLFGAVNERRSAAEQSNQSRTDALGHVTHELRTPLNAIGGYAELLQSGLLGPINAAQQKDLERIRWNQQHLSAVITEILTFVAADARRVEYNIGDVDLPHVAREVEDKLGTLFDQKQQQCVFEQCEENAVMARADPERVRQIVINLITNAIKYSPRNSQVTIRCGSTATAAFLEIADTGSGIAEDRLELIFEPFVQLAEGAESREGGVGLGLAIARQLARGMDGDVTVQSTVGRGSTFRLTLPSARPS
jgi:signal transduction histidine kinase